MRSVAVRRLVATVACALLGAFAVAQTALADATPIQLVLLYMPNVSNTDTPSASGVGELVLQEGEVRVAAAGLPHLEGDSRYVVWVLNTHTNEFLRLGAFNTDPDANAVSYENVVPDAIPDRQWNLLLLTIEHGPTPAMPGPKHSLAASFPLQGEQQPPRVLPNTGGLPDEAIALPAKSVWPPVPVLAALTAVLGLGAGYALGLKKQ